MRDSKAFCAVKKILQKRERFDRAEKNITQFSLVFCSLIRLNIRIPVT